VVVSKFTCILLLFSPFGNAEQQATIFSIRRDPAAYPRPDKVLEEFVSARSSHRVNHFCIAAYRYPDGLKRAWAWWREGKLILPWDASRDPALPVSLLTANPINLKHDVVASEADVQGSTSLVTRAWVSGIERDCQERGDQFTVMKERRHSGDAH